MKKFADLLIAEVEVSLEGPMWRKCARNWRR